MLQNYKMFDLCHEIWRRRRSGGRESALTRRYSNWNIKTLLMLLVLAAAALLPQAARAISGTGTESDPYTIANKTDWDEFDRRIDGGSSTYREKYWKLTADINLGTINDGIGENTSGYEFTGSFDGDGHTIVIDAMYWGGDDDGLFECTNNARIKNLKLTVGPLLRKYSHVPRCADR